nr:hypothetical protein [Tanacetum cinerariifolium]
MSWRHSSSAIDDLRPSAGSFNMDDVRRLSAHVVKLREMLEGVLVLFGLSHIWKSQTCDLVLRGADRNGIGRGVFEEPHHEIRPTLQRLPLYCTPPAVVDVAVSDLTLEDLVARTPSAKVIVKVEASQKRKASISVAASSHIVKVEASQSSGSTTQPNLFIDISGKESDEDDNACAEIILVTPIHSAAVIPSSRNKGGGSVSPAPEGPSTRDSQGKGIMIDAAVALSTGVTALTLFGAYSFSQRGGVVKNYEFCLKEWDAPHQPTLTILNKEVFKDPTVYKMVFDQFSTPGDMVWIEALTNDQPNAKMSVLHYLIMSYGGELLARYRGLLKLLRLLLKLTFLNKISEQAAEPLSVILQLEPKKLTRPTNVPASRNICVSPPVAKESTMTLVSSYLELLSNISPSSSAILLEPNEEWLNAMVDGPDNKMTSGAGNGKSGDVFVQGASHVVDDDVELSVVGSERVSFGPNDVVVALTVEEKGDGSLPSSIANE